MDGQRCSRTLCGQVLPGRPYRSRRTDNIVFDLPFCDAACMRAEAAVRKQKKRRLLGLDKDVRRVRDLRKKYGLTVDQWTQLYESQRGCCAICLQSLADIKTCTDHDHKTGEVRGLLCVECNHGLGKFRDNPENLIRAASYLSGAATVADQREVMRR